MTYAEWARTRMLKVSVAQYAARADRAEAEVARLRRELVIVTSRLAEAESLVVEQQGEIVALTGMVVGRG